MKLCQVVDKAGIALCVIAITIDAIKTVESVQEDLKQQTTRNTVETTADIAAGWVGGLAGIQPVSLLEPSSCCFVLLGKVVGATIGTAVLPGMGTIVGGLIGSIYGAIQMRMSLGSVVRQVGDAYSYDIIDMNCDVCDKTIRQRKYEGDEEKNICEECETEQIECQDECPKLKSHL